MEDVAWQEVAIFSFVLGVAAGSPAERFWESAQELVFWTAVLAVLLAVAVYVIAKIRPKSAKKERRASQWLSKYRDLYMAGKLSDEEFRTIKTTLAEQLQDELNDTGDKD